MCESLILSCRVFSKKFANYIDEAVEKAIIALISRGNNEETTKQKSNKEKLYLQRVTSFDHFAFYLCITAILTAYDLLGYYTAIIKYNYFSWFVFLPVPYVIIIYIIISIACIPCVICASIKSKTFKPSQYFMVTIISLLSLFVLSHAIWILLLFAAFPSLVLTRALFLVPMCLPLILIYRRSVYYFELILMIPSTWKSSSGSTKLKRFAFLLCKNVIGIIFFFITWMFILGLLNYISNYILSEISEEPLELMIVVAAVSLVIFRLAKLFTSFDEGREDDKITDEDKEFHNKVHVHVMDQSENSEWEGMDDKKELVDKL